MKKAKDFLADLIAIKTDGSASSVRQCIDYICDELFRNNILFERVLHPENGKESLIAGINVTRMRDVFGGVLFSGHIDTVTANNEDWQTPPFVLTEAGDKLYGRGAVDMKYFAAILLAELSTFKKLSYPVFLVFTSDEETDVCGARAVVSFLRERHICPQYALIGEPTDFKVCIANKGYAGYQTFIKGVAAHSSCPDLGVNAVYAAAKIVGEIEAFNAIYMPLGTTLNVGVINGGKERNSIADEAYIDWEIRYVSEEHRNSVLEALNLLYQRLEKEYPRAKIRQFEKETLPAFIEKTDGQLTKIIERLLQTEKLSLKYATEAGFFQQAGIETVICGAGDERLAHTTGEYITGSDMERYVVFLRHLLQQLAVEF